MNRRQTIPTAALVVAALASCGGGTGDPAAAPSRTTAPPTTLAPAPTARTLAEKAGCARSTDMPDLPLYVAEAVDCLDPAWTTKQDPSVGDFHVSFRVFGNNDGRDTWLYQAQTFGDHGVVKGDRWVVEIPDDLPNLAAVAALIVRRLGGQRVM